MKRKLRMGMIGGGRGAFIGSIHRMAARLDGQIELTAGALSSRPDEAFRSGEALLIPRVYHSYEEMIRKEKELPDDERIDFVSIVTPNHAHFQPAMMALENGFHVVIEKPMTMTLDEAKQLQQKVKATGLLLCLTHTYSGYPMVKEARQRVQQGAIGGVRKIIVTYVQGWLSTAAEKEGNAQANWRTDPKRSGAAGCIGDIGTHAAQLAEYISGLKITELSADLNTFVPGRTLDDDGNVLLKFENEASGVLIASQIAAGEENDLTIKIYGDKGGLEWRQMEPNTLLLKHADKPVDVLRAGAGNNNLSASATDNCRTPAGHPEGYIEAFANIYRNFAMALSEKISGNASSSPYEFPTVQDGVRGMAFIENVVASSLSKEKWTAFKV